jgi:hypothetical protein
MIPTIRPHPAGGHTVALPLPGTLTARVYVGQHATPAAAMEAARRLGRAEGELDLALFRLACNAPAHRRLSPC